MKTFYFDYNATTPLAPEVRRAMEPFWADCFANPSSLHSLGQKAAKAVRLARKQVARFIGAVSDEEIIFTSGGTESNNTAIRSALATSGKKKIITSAVEHSSVLKLCRELTKEGYKVFEIPVHASGAPNLQALKEILCEQTAIVSLMLANNETGVLFPVETMGRLVKEKGILFHVDAVQALGKFPLRVSQMPIDFLSLSAHKNYGPKGVGALYVRKGVTYRPLILGGGQERGRRGGTENVAGLVGFGEACALSESNLSAEIERLTSLRNHFEKKVLSSIPEVAVNGAGVERLCNTSNLRFRGIEAETLLLTLDQKGICVSSGSACMSGAHDPSHVLKAMGLSDEEANASIRFSFGRPTTEDDIQHLVAQLAEAVKRLRSLKAASQQTRTPMVTV